MTTTTMVVMVGGAGGSLERGCGDDGERSLEAHRGAATDKLYGLHDAPPYSRPNFPGGGGGGGGYGGGCGGGYGGGGCGGYGGGAGPMMGPRRAPSGRSCGHADVDADFVEVADETRVGKPCYADMR
uniref:rRNA 2'-O-methyltransferase fibrillarin-like n=1 Tax=Petromyzon marinus TaxID=7757 RepID=A0AAJ7UCC1_PETMA|nr:rRNA 2'-O-methyltransferase fibrillarin-like [Petromyzon marinus]